MNMRIVLALFAGITCTLCSCTVPWGVPTAYLIQDSTQSAASELPQRLSSFGFSDPVTEGTTFRFMLKGIRDMESLQEVQAIIREWSEEKKTPIDLQAATMVFRSVEANAESVITLRGKCTSGSKVLLDVGGTSVVDAAFTVESDSNWIASIHKSQLVQLKARDGWVYGVAIKEGVKQYLRVNIMSNDDSEKIGFDQLPSDSILRK